MLNLYEIVIITLDIIIYLHNLALEYKSFIFSVSIIIILFKGNFDNLSINYVFILVSIL